MKDLGKAGHILEIKFLQDRKHKMSGLSQAIYIDKIIDCFSMRDSKKGFFLLDMESL